MSAPNFGALILFQKKRRFFKEKIIIFAILAKKETNYAKAHVSCSQCPKSNISTNLDAE